jgi:hypothetical protein
LLQTGHAIKDYVLVINLSLLQLIVIMSMENVAQGQNMAEEEEAIMNNWQSDDSCSYHLLEKTGSQKGSDGRDLDYILEQQEVW